MKRPLLNQFNLIVGMAMGLFFASCANKTLMETKLLSKGWKIQSSEVAGVDGATLSTENGKTDKWLVGSDFQWQQWEKYSYFGITDSLKNSMRFSLGGAFTPSVSTVSGYWQRITYRGGIRYTKSYLELRNERINEFGISLGIGLPLPRTRSTINLAAEFGSRGTIANNLIKESFVKFTLGLSIFERWFIIKKYD